MIRSKIELVYDARNGIKKGIIYIKVESYNTLKDIVTFNVIDYLIDENGVEQTINQKEVTYPDSTIDAISSYVSQIIDVSQMTKTEKDNTELTHGLLIETQQNPLYNSVANDWELI